jgi:hypothetical protein
VPRRGAALAALIALAGIGWTGSAAARGAEPIQLTAGFDADAVLGAATALHLALHVDPRAPSPVSELRLLYPASLGVVSGGLGLESCRRPESDFVEVIVDGPLGRAGCPANAVMGYGTVRADVRISSTGQVIPEYATLVVLTGPIERGNLGLVIFIDGQRPFGGKFVLAGDVGAAPAPFGGALALRLPVVPGLADVATVALIDFRVVIGARQIVYYERTRDERRIAYHPEGVVLPGHCPKRGFRFRARVVFQDGGHAMTSATAPCPPPG